MSYPVYQHILPTRADHVAPGRHAVVLGINPGAAGEFSAPARAWLRNAAELTFGLCETFTLAELFDEPAHDVRSIPPAEMSRRVRDNASAIQALIEREAPRIVFQIGFECENFTRDVYGLRPDGDTVQRPQSSGRLLVPYRRGPTPWIVMMHFAAKGYGHADARVAHDHAWHILEDRNQPTTVAGFSPGSGAT